MRLFIAVEFTESFRSAVCGVMSALRMQGVDGNYTRRSNLHLTLAFIGESESICTIRQIMDRTSVRPFTISLSGCGRFGDLLWAGIEQSEPLTALADELCRKLRDAGFAVEKRPFRPHITMVRRASGNFRVNIPPAVMTVNSISLMKSERIDGILTYTPVYVRTFRPASG